MKKLKCCLQAIALLALTSTIQSATAQSLTWDWTWVGTNSTASGTITTLDTPQIAYAGSTNYSGSFTGYLATAISGTYNGQAITSLQAVNATTGTPDGNGDNLILSSDLQNGFVDANGLSFYVGSIGYNLYSSDESMNAGTWQGPQSGGTGLDFGTLNIQAAATPEPTIMVLAGLGIAGLLVLRRRQT